MSCCKDVALQGSLTNDEMIKENVKSHYRIELEREKPSCNCPFRKIHADSMENAPSYVKDVLKLCHQDVLSKFYGCLMVIPQVIEGRNILDMGSGAGRDSFLLSKMVGEKGSVTGVDMMQEMLDVTSKYADFHKNAFGFSQPNLQFKLGSIEKLDDAGIDASSLDIAVSNGVINLTSDKKAVFTEAFRILKDGGELYFSDVYCDRRLSAEVKNDEVLWGQCISGALWWQELVDICEQVDLNGPYLVESVPIPIKEEFKKTTGDAQFVAATYRVFKVPRKDQSKQRFVLVYKGSVKHHPSDFLFDINHNFKKGEAYEVSENIADVVKLSRFSEHFDVQRIGITQDESPNPFKNL